MDAVKFLKELERMCDSFGGGCSEDCEIYKLRVQNKRPDIIANYIPACDFIVRGNPEECVSIVEKWSAEHPAKTRLMDFLEKHSNAILDRNGIPYANPCLCGYCGEGTDEYTCSHCEHSRKTLDFCWNLPLEDK